MNDILDSLDKFTKVLGPIGIFVILFVLAYWRYGQKKNGLPMAQWHVENRDRLIRIEEKSVVAVAQQERIVTILERIEARLNRRRN